MLLHRPEEEMSWKMALPDLRYGPGKGLAFWEDLAGALIRPRPVKGGRRHTTGYVGLRGERFDPSSSPSAITSNIIVR